MKKYRVLLTGNNNIIMDDFFAHAQDTFEIISTSMRYDDMNQHLSICQPDIFVFCALDDSREDVLKLIELKRKITRQGVVFVIIGSEEDCENFQRIGVYMVDLALTKPIRIEQIKERIENFMRQRETEEEECEVEEYTEYGFPRKRKYPRGEEPIKLEKIKIEGPKQEHPKKHVLVIDDDPAMLKLMKEYLHEDYKVATAISGRIAYKFLECKHTDLILLDYEMPVEDGPQVLRNLRNNKQIDGVPVLFLTGITDREKIQKALSLKPQGYLLKPIDKEKLLGTIERFIG